MKYATYMKTRDYADQREIDPVYLYTVEEEYIPRHRGESFKWAKIVARRRDNGQAHDVIGSPGNGQYGEIGREIEPREFVQEMWVKGGCPQHPAGANPSLTLMRLLRRMPHLKKHAFASRHNTAGFSYGFWKAWWLDMHPGEGGERI